MKKLLIIIPLLFLLCLTFSCQQGEEATEEALGAQALIDAHTWRGIDNTLKKNYEDYFEAMIAMNVDAMFAHYSDIDFQELLWGIRVYPTVESIKEEVTKWFEKRESQGGEILDIKVNILSPDTAYVSAVYDYTINYKDGRIFEGKGIQTFIWKKGEAKWKITHDHASWAGEFLEKSET